MSGDTAVCPVCGWAYVGRGPTSERRQIASALGLKRHAWQEHAMGSATLAAAQRAKTD